MPIPLRQRDPTRLGPYVLTGRLGEGGQGVVFLATTPDGTKVAVKLLQAQFGGDPAARAFARELETSLRVKSFCTAAVLDANLDGDYPYVVSEYIEGPSLQTEVTTSGPIAGGSLDRLAIGTVTALAAIHASGIVHRDFKPGNVILGSDGPRVVDFGIARALDATASAHSGVVGTPTYMAPEQFEGQPAGPASDVFAWAGTMFFAATGRPPFGTGEPAAVMHRILAAEPELHGSPDRLRPMLRRTLSKDPAARPTAHELWQELVGHAPPATIVDATSPKQPRDHDPTAPSEFTQNFSVRQNRRAVLIGAIGGGVLFAAAGTTWFITHRDAKTVPPIEKRPRGATAIQRRGRLPQSSARLLIDLPANIRLAGYRVGDRLYGWNNQRRQFDEIGTFAQATKYRAITFSPDGRWVAIQPATSGVVIVDRLSGKRYPILLNGELTTKTPTWSGDGKRLLLTAIPKGRWRTFLHSHRGLRSSVHRAWPRISIPFPRPRRATRLPGMRTITGLSSTRSSRSFLTAVIRSCTTAKEPNSQAPLDRALSGRCRSAASHPIRRRPCQYVPGHPRSNSAASTHRGRPA